MKLRGKLVFTIVVCLILGALMLYWLTLCGRAAWIKVWPSK